MGVGQLKFVRLVFHNLPLTNQRCLIFAEVDLIPWTVREFIVYDFDDGVDDSTAVHADADVVADFMGFGRHEASLANEAFGATVSLQSPARIA
jgi:hypothetical protein